MPSTNFLFWYLFKKIFLLNIKICSWWNLLCIVLVCKHSTEPVNNSSFQGEWHCTASAQDFELFCQKSIWKSQPQYDFQTVLKYLIIFTFCYIEIQIWSPIGGLQQTLRQFNSWNTCNKGSYMPKYWNGSHSSGIMIACLHTFLLISPVQSNPCKNNWKPHKQNSRRIATELYRCNCSVTKWWIRSRKWDYMPF